MPRRIVLLSGHIGAGKTELATALVARFGGRLFKTREVIRRLRSVEQERSALQKAGESLDRETGGEWVATELRRFIDALSPGDAEASVLVVDAVRIRGQCDSVRRAYGSLVTHVHLEAPEEVRARRFPAKDGEVRELGTYDEVLKNRTEKQVDTLRDSADIVIDTGRCTSEDVVVRVASRIGLYGRELARCVDVLVGGQWGSEGKGNVAAYLAPEYDVLVRVGGPNAGHTVYQEPEPDTFYHIPAGTNRAPKTEIVLGPGATLELGRLSREITKAQLDPGRLRIDPQAMIIEQADIEAEARGLTKTIGSTVCGRETRIARRNPGHRPEPTPRRLPICHFT